MEFEESNLGKSIVCLQKKKGKKTLGGGVVFRNVAALGTVGIEISGSGGYY